MIDKIGMGKSVTTKILISIQSKIKLIDIDQTLHAIYNRNNIAAIYWMRIGNPHLKSISVELMKKQGELSRIENERCRKKISQLINE